MLTIVFSFLLLPFALIVAANVAGAESGFAALHQGVPGRSGAELLSLTLTDEMARTLGREPITVFYIVMLSLTGLIGIVVQPHIMGVCGAGKTEYEGRFGFTVRQLYQTVLHNRLDVYRAGLCDHLHDAGHRVSARGEKSSNCSPIPRPSRRLPIRSLAVRRTTCCPSAWWDCSPRRCWQPS